MKLIRAQSIEIPQPRPYNQMPLIFDVKGIILSKTVLPGRGLVGFERRNNLQLHELEQEMVKPEKEKKARHHRCKIACQLIFKTDFISS